MKYYFPFKDLLLNNIDGINPKKFSAEKIKKILEKYYRLLNGLST